eukprot:g4193.t1
MRVTPSSGSYPKVVIVGAGMAGLSATKELLRRGWPKNKVVLLEASGRLGGRMRTRRHKTGALCDHGAAYIHGTVGNPLVEVAKEAGIGLKQVSESNPWVETTPSVSLFCAGERVADAEAADTHEAFCQLMGRVRALAQQCDDANVPAGDAIENLLLEEPFCSLSAQELSRLRLRLASLSLWHGCDLTDMQLRSLEFEDKPFRGGQGVYGDFPGPHCVVEGGVERIAEAVASPQVRACLRFHARVDRVAIANPDEKAAAAAAAATLVGADGGGTGATGEPGTANLGADGACAGGTGSGEEEPDGGAVRVYVRKGGATTAAAAAAVGGRRRGPEGEGAEVVKADAVIVAVPLSVLQEGALEFDPPMPEETASALSRLGMGTYEKIIMEFEEPFWPADAPFIGCCCAQPSPLLGPSPPATAVAAAEAAAEGGSTTLTDCPTMAAPPLVGVFNAALSSKAMATASGSALPTLAVGHHHHHPTSAVEASASPAGAAATLEAVAAIPTAAAAECADSCCPSFSPHPAPALPAIPILLENYLWSKGVPVLTAAVTGERARIVSSASAAAAAAAAAGAEGTKAEADADSNWRAFHAREMYRRLIKPALTEGLVKDGEELPEPVSVFVTSWAQDPLQRGSYSYFPLGARDDDIHKAGQGATYGAPGAEPGAEGSERVFFAGEATVPGLEGSMHGAYLSGVRAVEDVAYAFGLPL